MKLFRVEVGGALYWVIAGCADQAAVFVMQEDGWTPGDSIDLVREVDFHEAEKARFTLEGHASTTMAFAFDLVRGMGGSGILACSEWP